jgi:hypothetical protein
MGLPEYGHGGGTPSESQQQAPEARAKETQERIRSTNFACSFQDVG